MERIPLETQTLYAEFLEQLIALEAQRSLGHLSGCFTRKEVKGETYYYFQYSEPGGISSKVRAAQADRLAGEGGRQSHQGRKGLASGRTDPLNRGGGESRRPGPCLGCLTGSRQVLGSAGKEGTVRP